MKDPLPQFDNPPVVETVMGIQFAALAKFSSPLAGWFWKKYLEKGWTEVHLEELLKKTQGTERQWVRTEQSSPLAPNFEEFDSEKEWRSPGIKIQVAPHSEPGRVQIISDDDERMIQLQSTRFIYNWRKGAAAYPTYSILRPEFDLRLGAFRRFVGDAELGELKMNQWEITYVNHIQKDQLWDNPKDWPNVIPDFYVPPPGLPEQRFEGFRGDWHFEIEPKRGRLHIAVQYARVESASGPEVLALQLTARGPVDDERGLDWNSGFEVGHEAIVRAFAAMTSPRAHEHWRRQA